MGGVRGRVSGCVLKGVIGSSFERRHRVERGLKPRGGARRETHARREVTKVLEEETQRDAWDRSAHDTVHRTRLIEQVPVPGVHLDPVEARLLGVRRGDAVLLDQRLDLLQRQRARGLVRVLLKVRAPHAVVLRVDGDVARGDDGPAVGHVRRVPGSSDVPQLARDRPALGVHGVDDVLPPGDLLGGVDPRRVRPAVRHRGDRRRLRDDEPRARALAVVLDVRRVRDAIFARARARQRREDDAVLELELAGFERLGELWEERAWGRREEEEDEERDGGSVSASSGGRTRRTSVSSASRSFILFRRRNRRRGDGTRDIDRRGARPTRRGRAISIDARARCVP